MERLWTPWRRAYIEGTSDDQKGDDACFLCLGAATTDDRAKLILFRGDSAFLLLNLYPYNTGHLMIAPFAHVGELAALDTAIAEEMMRLTQRSVDVLGRAYRPHGFNVGMNLGRPAGAGVPDHLHIHVVPRWTGDTNFMPIVADTKVLPESLEQTYERLEPYFHA
jgi:ATP adenylyltransferase